MPTPPTVEVRDDDDAHDQGFALDRQRLLLPAPVSRRRALGLFAAGAVGVGTALALPSAANAATTPKTPQETAGPYPGDGSNGPDVLDDNGIVRRDIRSSFGTASGVSGGIPLTIALTVVSAATSAPLPNAAVYLWHCDRLGRYSLYSDGVTGENYLRGVQITNAAGRVLFTSNYPACYSGRWPHIHFEVYPSRKDAVAATNRLLTSQLALPEATCRKVYASSLYPGSATNLGQTSLRTDNVFSDGWSTQLATLTGNVTNGFRATLTIAV